MGVLSMDGRDGRTDRQPDGQPDGPDGRQIPNKCVIIIRMIKNVYLSDSVDSMLTESPPNASEKHPAWKGERTGLFIRVPVEIAKELRDEAQQTRQHFNDVAVNRLRTNVK